MKDEKNIVETIMDIGLKAKLASSEISTASNHDKKNALLYASMEIKNNTIEILLANKKDLEYAKEKGLSNSMMNRLKLTEEIIDSMAKSLIEISKLEDPIGKVLEKKTMPNGLIIKKISVPLGVIGVIYESRPNVTSDAGAICIKSGNAAILRCGSESINSSLIIAKCLQKGLKKAGLNENIVQIIPTRDREAVSQLLKMQKYIDIIIPRGGKSLITKVMTESKIPIFSHLEGICHTYIDSDVNINKALQICHNAKLRRPGICGATETILININIAPLFIPKLAELFQKERCEIRGCERSMYFSDKIIKANTEDWTTEYLDKIVSIKIVNTLTDAVDHINTYGSHHTDAIISNDEKNQKKFLKLVDSAICMSNTSTQFADGGEFGMGAEIGIATGRIHARGPVGISQLTIFKYKVIGSGQLRTK